MPNCGVRQARRAKWPPSPNNRSSRRSPGSPTPTKAPTSSRSAWCRAIVIRDGNVAFAIEVEPERGPRLEPLRKAAEKAVDALPGVLSVTAVLTAEAQSQGRGRRAGGPATRPWRGAAGARGGRAGAARRGAGGRRDRRGRLGQGRGRQVDRRRQSRAGAEGERAARRGARRRHLRPLDAAHAGDFRPAALARRQEADRRWRITGSTACRWAFSSPRTRR